MKVLYTAPMSPDGIASHWRHEYDSRHVEIEAVEPTPQPVAPSTAAVTCAVDAALRAAPPDVVIVDDLYGACYASMRARSLGIDFRETLFVVYCHGTTSWISEAHRKLRRWVPAFEVQLLERESVPLADVVVSPSAYMVDWMRTHGWQLPRVVVAPYLTRAGSDSDTRAEAVGASRIRRLAYFGRLEDRKGVKPFIEAVNRLDTSAIADVELLFVGKETPSWTVARVRAALTPTVTHTVGGLRFETELERIEALELLSRPGTLAVMPSLVDNSPNVIYECVERGIPFLASSAGGGPELVAVEDRQRTFVRPTADEIAHALRRLLARADASRPAQPAFDHVQTIATWQSILATSPNRSKTQPRGHSVSAIVLGTGSSEAYERCLLGLSNQKRAFDQIVRLDSLTRTGLQMALAQTAADVILLVEDCDEPDPNCLAALLEAQAASDADVVTCAFRSADSSKRVQFFLGEPQELGVVANYYGLGALYRRAVLEWLSRSSHPDGESDWLRHALVSLRGHHIVSIPRALISSPRVAESGASHPLVALGVIREFERTLPRQLQGMPTLGASFAARPTPSPAVSLTQRVRWVLSNEGARGVVRRAAGRLRSSGGVSAPAKVSAR